MGVQATYINPWHRPEDKHSSGPFFRTDAKPVEYKDYLIYNRIPGTPGKGDGIWDVVKKGACITQMAGPRGAREAIDKL